MLSPDGSRLFTHNFMQRTVSVFDVASLTLGGGVSTTPIANISTVSNELLSPEVLTGKQIFYNAADTRMGLDGYISCSNCHLDGGQDGRVWDFTDRGEGLRNTIDLRGRSGLGHGNVHWSGSFDELQDFENEIRNAFSGTGFLSETQFLQTANPLAEPKAGLSAELDALAAYVGSLNTLPASPDRSAARSLSADAEAGRKVFLAQGCSGCHAGAQFTDGLRHDVGTIELSSGVGIYQPLAGIGFETPTLKGIWSAAPYLHNGQAQTLDEVLLIPGHGSHLNADQRADLVAYLQQIDSDGGAFPTGCDASLYPGDSDCDGLLDSVEFNSGEFIDSSNTGTDPLNADTDGDGVSDGDEVNNGTDPTTANFLVPAMSAFGMLALFLSVMILGSVRLRKK